MTRWTLFLLLVLTTTVVHAQHAAADKIGWYARAHPSSKLFVHFDKNIYAGAETAWFTAYLTGPAVNEHTLLCVALARDGDTTMLQQTKFVMANGLAFGHMTLPDSMVTGSYRLLAFTDRIYQGRPEAVFVQPIVIKAAHQLPFHMRLQLEQPFDAKGSAARLRLSVTDAESRFLPKPVNVLYQYGSRRISARSDVAGQLAFDLPPDEKTPDPNVYVRVVWKNDTDRVALPLVPPLRRAVVGFYPEGGHLVCNLPIRVAFEVHDQYGASITAPITLLEENRPLIETQTDENGIGSFRLVCMENRRYTLRVKHPQVKDSTYVLPAGLPAGIAIQAGRAVAGDTLRLRLMSTSPQRLGLHLHNFQQSFLSVQYAAKADLQNLVFPLNDVPEGLCAVTITDSLDRPLAERIFYAHYKTPAQQLSLQTGKAAYGKREEVTMDVELLGGAGNAIVSLACVQANRISSQNKTDIVSHLALRDELADFPLTAQVLQNRERLEELLLLRGWRRYSWNTAMAARPADTLIRPDSLIFRGVVLRNDKPFRKVVELMRFTGDQFGLINTAPDGTFRLARSEVFVPANGKVQIFYPGRFRPDFDVQVRDPFQALAARYARLYLAPPVPMAPTLEQENRELSLRNDEKVITLKEVVITKKGADSFTARGPNACGDYVCRYNIFNCPNHPGDPDNRPPVAGKVYMRNGVRFVYAGCSDRYPSGAAAAKVNPIYGQKEFYVNTFSEPVTQAIWSTLYWNHGLMLSSGKKMSLRFFTGDIAGTFRIVVQGLSDAGPVYLEKEFEVRAGK